MLKAEGLVPDRAPERAPEAKDWRHRANRINELWQSDPILAELIQLAMEAMGGERGAGGDAAPAAHTRSLRLPVPRERRTERW